MPARPSGKGRLEERSIVGSEEAKVRGWKCTVGFCVAGNNLNIGAEFCVCEKILVKLGRLHLGGNFEENVGRSWNEKCVLDSNRHFTVGPRKPTEKKNFIVWPIAWCHTNTRTS